jgi:hypothetical protein
VVTLRASGPIDAVAFLVFVVPRFMNARDSYVLTGDPIAHAVDPSSPLMRGIALAHGNRAPDPVGRIIAESSLI